MIGRSLAAASQLKLHRLSPLTPSTIVHPLAAFTLFLWPQQAVLITMDPLSIAASIVGITMAALQSAQFLTNLIDSIAEAPATVAGISTDLLAIQATLQSLARALQEGSSQILLSEQVKHAVENCHTACRTFQMQVEHWTKHSTKDKMFWMDRWKLGLFGLERIKIFREQLGNCKSTLSIALSTATTYVSPLPETHCTISKPLAVLLCSVKTM